MEVLTSSELRQKYDNYRQGRYGYPRASGVKGNPYQDYGKNFAPPPRPPGFPQRPPMQKRQTTASTADKYAEYASYAKDVPPSTASRRAGKADATWKAWDGMRPQNKATSSQSTSTGASTRTASTSRPNPPPVPPRPNPQKQPEGAFGNSTRASRGYVPESPGGDEPPVSNSNYFTTRIHTNVFPTTSAAARNRRRAPSTGEPDSESADSTFTDSRQRTPYQTHGGEKFDPWNGASNIGRSRSTRETNRGSYYGDDEEEASPTNSHQRSSSVPDDSDNSPRDRQNEEGMFHGHPNTGATTSNGDGFSPTDDSKGKGTSKLYANQSPSNKSPNCEIPRDEQQATGCASEENVYRKKTLNLPPELQHLLAKAYPRSSSEAKFPRHVELNAFELSLQETIRKLSASKYGLGDHQSGATQSVAHSPKGSQHTSQQTNSANSETSNSNFESQFSGNPFATDPHRFTRNSTDNINTRFVAEDDATNWQFNAGSPVDERGRPAMPRSKSGSRVGRRSPINSQAQQTPFAEPSNGGVPPQNGSFNPEEWSEKISPEIFEAPTVQKTSIPANRPIRNPSRKARPVRMTAGTAGMVDTDESSSGQEDILKKPAAAGGAHSLDGTASPNAMDVDPPVTNSGENGVRNIPVTPSRPEWRAGDVGGIKVDARPDIGQQAGFSAPVAGSEDSEEFQATLSDLRNVEPLTERATGLESFGDLKSNLPFTSASSGQIPTRKPVPQTHNLDLPPPPKPPHAPPALAVPGLKPSAVAWKKYMDEFTGYMAQWHAFDTRFFDHFRARNIQIKAKLESPSWLESRDGAGIQEYMTWVEQDREVRARWAEACNDHEMNVRLFAAHREKMMK